MQFCLLGQKKVGSGDGEKKEPQTLFRQQRLIGIAAFIA